MKKRFLAGLLTLAMLMTLAPVAFAADSNSSEASANGNATALNELLKTVDADHPLTAVDESVWPEETPVYYNGTFYKTHTEGFTSKGALDWAIEAANTANSDDIAKIYVRPGSNNLVVNAHQNIKTSIAIYGNNASLGYSGWEPCVEYPGENYHTLTKDISIAIYNLNNGAGVWGWRLSGHKIDVTMENCQNVHEFMINGQNASAAKSINNYTIKNCTFDGNGATQACPVTTTSAGKVVVENCTFANLTTNYVVNINNKNGGNTDVEVTGCEFKNCGAAGKEAVRLTGEATGSTVKGTLSNLTFDNYTVPNAIAIGNSKPTNNKAEVSYNISETNGNLKTYMLGTGASTTSELSAGEEYTGANVKWVAEVNGTKYPTVAAAVAAADGNTVTLLQDVEEDVTIPANKTVTLNLNGKKLTNVQSDTITVTKDATLTIQGEGTVDNVTNSKAAIYNNGTTTLSGGKYTRSAEAANTTSSSGGNSYYNILNHGVMTIDKGVEVYSSGHFSSLVANGYYNYTKTSDGDKTAYIENVGQADPRLTINGGTFSGGINTIKNDDNATLTVKDGEFSNITQAVVQNNNIATIEGGTFNADGYNALENWYYNGSYNMGKLTVTNGKFAGNIATNKADGISISGGLFTENPSKFLAASTKTGYKFAAVNHASPYLFEVKEVEDTDIEVIPAVGAAQAKKAENVAAEDVDKVEAAAKVVAAPKISEAAAVVANSIDADQYTDKATNIQKADRVEVRAYLEVTPKGYNSDKSYTLEITPKYDVVVVGTDNTEQKFTGGTLSVSNETPVSIQLPDGFVDNTNTLYVQHKNHEYDATVSVNEVKVNGAKKNIYTATFTTPDGFSPFTISKTSQTVAKIGEDKYTSFADAVNAVPANGTIDITGGTSPYTGTANKTFTVKNSTSAEITVNGQKIAKDESYTFKYTSSSSSGSSSTTYAVNVNAATNGTVAADKKTASKGTTVTVTAPPSAGYVVDAVKVVDKDGKDVAVTVKDGKYSFVMPASAVTVTASFKAETPAPSGLPFTDVKSGDWFYDAVKYAYENGLMNGTSETIFAPNGTMNRAMIVTVLYRLEKSPAVTAAAKFTDVPAGQWYSDAVAWAAANNIVNGYDETTFGPLNAVTREQMAAILYRYEQYKGLENVTLEENLNRFPDKDKISAYAVPALQWAVGQKIINGNADGTLDPTGTATRAQVAQIFMNLLNK